MRTAHSFRPNLGARGSTLCTLALATVLAPPAARGQVVATMSLPTGLSARAGDTITLSVNLNVVGNQLDNTHGRGIGAAGFVISYNSGLFSSVGPVGLGSLISNPAYGFANYTVNITTGLIQAVTQGTPGTPGLDPGTSGALAMITTTVSPGAAPGTYTLSLLASSGLTVTSIVDNTTPQPITYSQGSGLTLVNGSLTVVPEPGSLLLTGLSAALVGGVWRRKAARRLSTTV